MLGGRAEGVGVPVGGSLQPAGRVGQVPDRAGGRDLRAVAGQDPGQDVHRGRRQQRLPGDHGVRVAVAGDDQVQVVGTPAAGQRDVQQLTVFGAGGHGVGDVGGDALGAVHGGRVAEADVLADVGRRQMHGPAGAQVDHVQAAVGPDRDHLPAVAVLDQSVAVKVSRRSLLRVMIVSPAPARVPSARSTSRPATPGSLPPRPAAVSRSVRARAFRSATSSRVGASMTASLLAAMSAAQAVWVCSTAVARSPTRMRPRSV